MTEEYDLMIQRGQWAELFNKCVEDCNELPTNPRPHAYMGFCYMQARQMDRAVICLQKAVRLDPNYFDAQFRLAQCLDRMQRFDEALEPAQEAVRLRPSDPTAQVLLRGIQRYANDKMVDGWKKSEGPMFHNITLSND